MLEVWKFRFPAKIGDPEFKALGEPKCSLQGCRVRAGLLSVSRNMPCMQHQIAKCNSEGFGGQPCAVVQTGLAILDPQAPNP